MDNVYKIGTLANGVEVKVRPVSPHVRQGLYLRLEEAIPPKPELPVKVEQSIDGHSEPVAVSEGDLEYTQWKQKYTAWDKNREETESRINRDNMLRFTVYAVIGWRKKVGLLLRFIRARIRIDWLWSLLGLGWRSSPPSNWHPDPIIRIPDEMGEWGVFVLTELVSDELDYAIIQRHALPRAHELLTQEEVGRQLDGFPSDGG